MWAKALQMALVFLNLSAKMEGKFYTYIIM